MKSKTKRHTTPYYPRFFVTPAERTLAYLDIAAPKPRLVTEAGGEIDLDPFTWERLSFAIFSHNLQVWVDDIGRNLRPMLVDIFAECLLPPEERRGKQWCECHLDPDDGSELVGISLHRTIPRQMADGKTRHVQAVRHINCASRWTDGAVWQIELSNPEENAAWMAKIRALCERLQVGIKGTPGGVGEAALRNTWRDTGMPRVSRPDLRCVAALEQWSIGSRMELYAEPGIIHDVAYRMDMSGAYPAFAGALPGGHLGYIGDLRGEHLAEDLLKPYDGSKAPTPSATWFARCLVQIDEPGVPAGDVLPFAIKRYNPQARRWDIEWPTKPGLYGHKDNEECYLWREQADELIRRQREEGTPVHIVWMGQAFVWPEWSHQLRPWAKVMEEARRDAPSKSHEKLVKLATNAGFGRLGMGYHSRRIIPFEQATPADEPLVTPGGLELDRYSIRTEREDPGTPIHWHRYVLMRCCLEMSKAMHHNFLRGVRNLAVFVDEIETDRYPGVEYNEPTWRMGGWKLKELHGWVGYGPGHIHAIEEQRMPGVKAWRKEQLYRWGEPRQTRRKHLNEEAAAALIPLTMERWRQIQAERIAPFYADQAAAQQREREREAARGEQLRILRESAERQMEREAWKTPKWGK